jgi:proteic killer suppression protein
MNIIFSNRKLQRCYEHSALAAREWGPVVAPRYIERINILKHARMFEEVATLQFLRLHPLTGEREGQRAMTLHRRWRLIVERLDKRAILVKEVSHHYGD